jgi:hypothetical protein
VPYQFSDEGREKRVNQSNDLLSFLGTQQEIEFHDKLTKDAAWTYYKNSSTTIWFSPEEDVPDRLKATVRSMKLILIVSWCASGVFPMNRRPKGETLNSKYCRQRILPDFRATQPSDGKKPITILHTDKAKLHRLKATVQKMAEFK